jgi:hypothetical protein
MWLRLRQIALVAAELEPVEKELIDVLGIQVCYRDPGVSHFGLENALFPIGNQLLEVVAPTQEMTAGGRYLERRGGDGGYMVITQCDDHEPRRARVAELGIRIVTDHDGSEFRNMQLHPRDTGGSFFEIDEQLGENAHDPDGAWHPAGPDWQRAKVLDRVSGISAAEMQCDDPGAIAEKWSQIAQLPIGETNGSPSIDLDNAVLRFVSCTDGRPEGLSAIDVICTDKEAILNAAKAINAVSGENQVYLCGMRINLV